MSFQNSFISLFSRVIIVAVIFFAVTPVSAQQNHFIVPVDFKVENGTFDKAIVRLAKNGAAPRSIAVKSNMRLKLDFNSDYVISFSKTGYITKSIAINTNAPAERISKPVEPYKIGVRLFKQYEGVNIVVYNQPVARIQFNALKDEFDYDTDYSKSILSDLNSAEQQLSLKAEAERLAVSGIMNSVVADDKKDQNSSYSNSGQMNQRSLMKAPGAPIEKQAIILDPRHPKKNILAGNNEGEDNKSGLAQEGNEDKPEAGSAVQGIEQPDPSLFSGKGEDTGNRLTENSGAEVSSEALQVSGNTSYYRRQWKERGRQITTVKVINGLNVAEYRKVDYDWGGIFYFKDLNFAISQNVYLWATGEK